MARDRLQDPQQAVRPRGAAQPDLFGRGADVDLLRHRQRPADRGHAAPRTSPRRARPTSRNGRSGASTTRPRGRRRAAGPARGQAAPGAVRAMEGTTVDGQQAAIWDRDARPLHQPVLHAWPGPGVRQPSRCAGPAQHARGGDLQLGAARARSASTGRTPSSTRTDARPDSRPRGRLLEPEAALDGHPATGQLPTITCRQALGLAGREIVAREPDRPAAALQQAGDRDLLVVAAPGPGFGVGDRAGGCRGGARARPAAGAAARRFSRRSTSLPGMATWLESITRMSPGPSSSASERRPPRTGGGGGHRQPPRSARGCGSMQVTAQAKPAVGHRLGDEAGRVAGADLEHAPRRPVRTNA